MRAAARSISSCIRIGGSSSKSTAVIQKCSSTTTSSSSSSTSSSSSAAGGGGTAAVYNEIARTALDRGFATRIGNITDDNITVVFLRHGQSTWNQQNIFIGMTDTPLTLDGIEEAKTAGKLLKQDGLKFDHIYTSLLRRSIKTAWMVLQELGLEWVPVAKDWRLNERHYGALVGLNKKRCVEEYGKDQVKRWRRSWDEPPPPMSPDSPYWPANDERYHALGIADQLPRSECLKDVTKRTSVFWDEVIVPQLKQKKRVLIVGHENNLRSIIKRLDEISDKDILQVELPRAIPLVYKLHPTTLKPIKPIAVPAKRFDRLAVKSENVPNDEKDKVSATPLFHDPYHGTGVTAEFLSGRYLCDAEQLKQIAKRDQQQVYDLRVRETLEKAPFLGVSPIKILGKGGSSEL